MRVFDQKRIVLGVTGSIAAYKSVTLASSLTKAGALVDVILTDAAAKLVAEAEAYQAEVVNRAAGDASRFDQIYQAYLQDKAVTRERIYIETVEEIFSNVEKVIIDGQGSGNGVVPYLPLKELNKSAGGQ